MNGECNATNVQGKNYNLHKLQGGHVPQCPIAGDATVTLTSCSIHPGSGRVGSRVNLYDAVLVVGSATVSCETAFTVHSHLS